METELPINRKERFYTGTVLPSLLFHNGRSNFFRFLKEIKGFPSDVNEKNTQDNFLFYTEYNLKESAGRKSRVGMGYLFRPRTSPIASSTDAIVSGVSTASGPLTNRRLSMARS